MRYPELPSALVDRSGYDKGRYQILRNRLLALLGGVCVRCGTDQNLEFDHRDPKSKKFTIMAKWNNYTNEELYKEIEKCQLLCKKHHIEKTREDIGVPHGGGVSGKRDPERGDRCRCDLCKAKYNEYMRALKKRLKEEKKK